MNIPFLHLAPMEGVVDYSMRKTLTEIGGIDHCVTEFVRVTKNLHPNKIFHRFAPELFNKSKTDSNVPVFIQLLGGEPGPLAENALRAVQLGACGIDLNFGCPAKLVNRHDGGSVLLKYPHRLNDIVKTVRSAIPADIPLTAKMRLGYEDKNLFLENLSAIASEKVSWITVHARTKVDGYKPPAYWSEIKEVKNRISVPIVANGEIWTVEDFFKCKLDSGCDHFMIGRGAIADPYIFLKIKLLLGLLEENDLDTHWLEFKKTLNAFFDLNSQQVSPYYAQAKTKQWLRWLSRHRPEALDKFNQVKTIRKPDVFKSELMM